MAQESLSLCPIPIEAAADNNSSRFFIFDLKKPEPAKDRALLLTVILADAINLGLNKMAEACPGTSIAKLSWLSAWHIRDETYSKALATLVNHQRRQTFASHWGEGTTSSSDGQLSGRRSRRRSRTG
jgi:hypothetical protein